MIIHPFPQVLFTADLRSFSSYGLGPPPSAQLLSDASTPEEKTEKHLPPSVLGLQAPPVISPLKRKWDSGQGETFCLETAESWNVADGVKKRRR